MSGAKRVCIDLCDSDTPDVLCQSCQAPADATKRCNECCDILCATCQKNEAAVVSGKVYCRWCVQHLAALFAHAEKQFASRKIQ